MAEYQAIVDIVYNISDKQKEKLKNVDGRNTIVIDAESNFSKVEKDVAELKKEFNSLKTIFKSFGKDSSFEDVDKQISSAALKLNNLSKAVQDIQQGGRKNAVIDINISELNKIIDFANTFESTYKNTFDEVKKRFSELFEDMGKSIKQPEISSNESSIQKQINAVRELKSELAKIEDPLKTSRNRDIVHVEKYGEDGSRTLEQQQAIKATLEEKERVLLRINVIAHETPEALPIDEQKKYNTELEITKIYLEQVNSILHNLQQNKLFIENADEQVSDINKIIEATKGLDDILDDIGNNESRSLEFEIGIPEDEKRRIIDWFAEVKGIAENVQSISISPKFEEKDSKRTLVGYVATIKQVDDETKRVENSVVNLNAELGSADGSWNRFTETIKSSISAKKEFNIEFQRELATQQIDTLKAKLGELPFDFKKVEEAAINIVDKKSLEAFNNELTLTKEKIKTAQAEVKNENSLQAFTAMEKNLEKIPVRIEVLEERIKKFATVEGFDKVSGDIGELNKALEKVNNAKDKGDINETIKAYDELTSAISRAKEEMSLLSARKSSGNLSAMANENTLEVQALFELLKEADTKFNTVAGKSSEAKDRVDKLIASFRELSQEGVDSKLISNFEDLAKKLEIKFDKIDFIPNADSVKKASEGFQKINIEPVKIPVELNSDQAKNQLKEIAVAADESLEPFKIKEITDNKDLKDRVVKMKLVNEETEQQVSATLKLKDALNGIAEVKLNEKAVFITESDIISAEQSLFKLRNNIAILEKDWSKALSDPNFGHRISEIKKAVDDLSGSVNENNIGDVDGLSTSFKNLQGEIKASGQNVLSFADNLERTFTRLGQYLVSTAIYGVLLGNLRGMYNNVLDINKAMTELYKVTDETSTRYNKFLDDAVQRAHTLGATLTDVITATADFARMGYSITDAEALSNAAIIYKNVGDGINNISDASDSIISTMKAFDIKASESMSIVDKFNEVGIWDAQVA